MTHGIYMAVLCENENVYTTSEKKHDNIFLEF